MLEKGDACYFLRLAHSASRKSRTQSSWQNGRLRFACVGERPCCLVLVKTLMRLTDLLVGGKKESRADLSWCLFSFLPFWCWLDSAHVLALFLIESDWWSASLSPFLVICCQCLFTVLSIWFLRFLLVCIGSFLPSLCTPGTSPFADIEKWVNPAGRHFRQPLLSLSLHLSSTRSLTQTDKPHAHYLLVIGSQQPLISKGLTLFSFLPFWSYFHPPLVSACMYTLSLSSVLPVCCNTIFRLRFTVL